MSEGPEGGEGAEGPGGPGAEGEAGAEGPRGQGAEGETFAPIEPEPELAAAAPPPEAPSEPYHPPPTDGDYPPLSPYAPEPSGPSAPWPLGPSAPPPSPEDEPLPHAPRRPRRTTLIVALAIVGGILIAVCSLLGRANAEHYLLVCGTDHVSAEQGRSFPPWGSHDLTGPEWKPIPLPPNAECKARETDDLSALGGWYLGMLIDRASATLSAKDLLDTLPAAGSAAPASTAPGPLDLASAELDQALLLARAPEHRDQRAEIERLEGDVAYWRARLRLREASAALADAAKQFDSAAASHPHYATDAGDWATFLRKLVGDLHAGPGGAPPAPPAVPLPVAPPATTTTAPPATELPVEPAAGSAAPAAEPAPPIDAGAPGGGVLL